MQTLASSSRVLSTSNALDSARFSVRVAQDRSLIVAAIRAHLLSKYLAPDDYRVEPLCGVSSMDHPAGAKQETPALLKGYLRLGTWIGGEPAWDPSFDCADFFVLLPIERIVTRYAKYSLGFTPIHYHFNISVNYDIRPY